MNKKILPIDDTDEFLNYLWLGMGDIRKIKYKNDLDLNPIWDDKSKVPDLVVELCRNPHYLHFVCKYILNIDLLPYQVAILQTLWVTPLPLFIASRGAAKSFLLSVYIVLRLILHQGCRVAVVGAALRQSLVLYNYINTIWDNAPVLRDVCGGKKEAPKRELHAATFSPGNSHAMFLPMGTGDKVRGMRANYILADEIASISDEIFNVVIRGFAAVKSDGLYGHVVKSYKEKAMKEMGMLEKIIDSHPDWFDGIPTSLSTNQIIMSGTAYYQFNHIYKYYRYYKTMIQSGGDPKILKQEFPDMQLPDIIRPRDYAVIRLPYDQLPEGMIDQAILSQGQATMDPQIFGMEYSAVFPSDSEGFYLASQLNSATCPVQSINGPILFGPRLFGDKERQYVMGIDPASENDNFTVNILELNGTYRAVSYQWSTNRKAYEQLYRDGYVDQDIKDYNTFVLRHIRSLMTRFNIVSIVCDSGGGGLSLRESFKDADKLQGDEQPIYDVDDENNRRYQGLHILRMMEFSDYSWRCNAHYGLKKDIIDKKVIFPYFDLAEVEAQNLSSSKQGKSYDTVEDCYLEIEQCKKETTFIKHQMTPLGQEKWDVPKIAGLDAEELRKTLKRDRFTSLLLSNWAARTFLEENKVQKERDEAIGEAAHRVQVNPNDRAYMGDFDSIPGRKIFY